MLKLKVKYHDPNMPKLQKIEKGDWIDLRLVDILSFVGSSDTPTDRWNKYKSGWRIEAGDILCISLGVSIELPPGYEAIIAPRSSLFKKHRLILTNSIGIIDNSYHGNSLLPTIQ